MPDYIRLPEFTLQTEPELAGKDGAGGGPVLVYRAPALHQCFARATKYARAVHYLPTGMRWIFANYQLFRGFDELRV